MMILMFSLISINMEFLVNKILFVLLLGATLMQSHRPSYRTRPQWMATAGVCLVLLIPFWLNLLVASRLYAEGRACERRGNPDAAVRYYNDALSVEPFQAESSWRIFLIYSEKYKRTGSIIELSEMRSHFNQATRSKRDIHYGYDFL
jgi:tetratricopeptide (TPR) repeat protein